MRELWEEIVVEIDSVVRKDRVSNVTNSLRLERM